ncbi:MAG: GNAT family N-acetyltransferase [Chloroflexota bacterium]|nr:GNAT family N-acetyltransferase [Chloroflexota bacterium]
MSVVCIDPLVDPRWQRLVDRHASSVFHSPAWLKVLVDTYGFETGALVLLDGGGEPRAGLPFCRVDDLMGERLAALPFSDYCDPLVSTREEWDALAGVLLARGCPVTLRPLHNAIPSADERFAHLKQAKWHGVDLRPDLEAHWARLHDSARRAIQKAERGGVQVRAAAGPEELRAFFELHLGVRKHKYRLLAQPYRFFENIWAGFVATGHGRLSLAVHEEQVIGGVLFLEWKDTLYYKFNASAPNDLGLRPNDLLMWEGIKYGKARGLTSLDLGLSDWDQEGLIRYKRKFATDEKTISFLKYVPDGWQVPAGGQLGPLLGQLTELLTDADVSDRVTDRAGDLLYRFFV